MNFRTADYWDARYSKYGPFAAGPLNEAVLTKPLDVVVEFEKKYRPIFRSFVGHVSSCLYVGSGPGRMIPFVLEFVDNVTCVDISEVAVDTLKEHYRDVPSVEAELCSEGAKLGFETGCFQLVVLLNTLRHIRDDFLDFHLNDYKRVVAKGGSIVCVDSFYRNRVSDRKDSPHVNHLSEQWIVKHGFSGPVNGFCIWRKDEQ